MASSTSTTAASEEVTIATMSTTTKKTTLPRNVAHLITTHGVLLFDETRDAEQKDKFASTEANVLSRKIMKAVPKMRMMPVNMALGAAVGVPGFVVGMGGNLLGGINKNARKHRVTRNYPSTLFLAPISARSLHNCRGKENPTTLFKKQSPYIKFTLCVEGHHRLLSVSTDAQVGGGTDFKFQSNDDAVIGIPALGETGLSNVALLVEVMDNVEFIVANRLTGRDTHIGGNVIYLDQLEDDDVEDPTFHINVPLYAKDDWSRPEATPTRGTVRLRVGLKTNQKPTSEASR